VSRGDFARYSPYGTKVGKQQEEKKRDDTQFCLQYSYACKTWERQDTSSRGRGARKMRRFNRTTKRHPIVHVDYEERGGG